MEPVLMAYSEAFRDWLDARDARDEAYERYRREVSKEHNAQYAALQESTGYTDAASRLSDAELAMEAASAGLVEWAVAKTGDQELEAALTGNSTPFEWAGAVAKARELAMPMLQEYLE